jgi:nitrate reductase assembly molybdenum cofactor insertion protein NarJ
MKEISCYSIMSALFSYPDISFKEKLGSLKNFVKDDFPEAYQHLVKFEYGTMNFSIHQLEENYINTFLLNPVSGLDIGFVLFGDDYKRNEFLVYMQGEQHKAANDCGRELADHLPNVLNLIPKFEDKDLCNEFTYCLLIPAIKEICRKFNEGSNYYIHVFSLLNDYLERDFGKNNFEQFVIKPKKMKCHE